MELIKTERTDALLADRRHQDASDWNADDVMAFLQHARKLERELNQAKGLLEVAACPNCDGSGSTAVKISSRKSVTREMASDACCPEMEGSLYSDDEWEQQQCQWCDEKKALMLRVKP